MVKFGLPMAARTTKRPTITCPKCRGLGDVYLGGELWSVLQLFLHSRRLSSVDVMAILKLDAHPTAINNRLEDLRGLGFLERVRSGRRWMYFRNHKT